MTVADTSIAVQNTQRQTTHAKHDLKLNDHVAEILPVSRLIRHSPIATFYPTSSKLETEPQCHHRPPIPQRIVNAGHQGYQ